MEPVSRRCITTPPFVARGSPPTTDIAAIIHCTNPQMHRISARYLYRYLILQYVGEQQYLPRAAYCIAASCYFKLRAFGRTKSFKLGVFPCFPLGLPNKELLNCCLLPPPCCPPLPRRASDLLKVEVLRLDWQRISSIQNLDIFTHLRELYLQHNRIQVIEELDTLRSLEFLALGSNRIRRLENLRHLSKVSLPNCRPLKYGGGVL